MKDKNNLVTITTERRAMVHIKTGAIVPDIYKVLGEMLYRGKYSGPNVDLEFTYED